MDFVKIGRRLINVDHIAHVDLSDTVDKNIVHMSDGEKLILRDHEWAFIEEELKYREQR